MDNFDATQVVLAPVVHVTSFLFFIFFICSYTQSEQKWKQLAELATSKCEFELAQECLHQAQDFGGLLLLASSAGNLDMVNKLGVTAEKAGQNNIAFLSYFTLGK